MTLSLCHQVLTNVPKGVDGPSKRPRQTICRQRKAQAKRTAHDKRNNIFHTLKVDDNRPGPLHSKEIESKVIKRHPLQRSYWSIPQIGKTIPYWNSFWTHT